MKLKPYKGLPLAVGFNSHGEWLYRDNFNGVQEILTVDECIVFAETYTEQGLSWYIFNNGTLTLSDFRLVGIELKLLRNFTDDLNKCKITFGLPKSLPIESEDEYIEYSKLLEQYQNLLEEEGISHVITLTMKKISAKIEIWEEYEGRV